MATIAYFNDTTANLGAAGTFTGATRDIGSSADRSSSSDKFPGKFRAIAFANQASAATTGFRIEMSNDGTTWRTAAQAAVAINVPSVLEVPIVTRFYRVVYVNGATIQTQFMLNSAIGD